VAVSGSYAYVADDWAGLRVIDFSTPGSPFEVGFFDTCGIANDVIVSGSYAYIADGPQGLRVIDISTPVSPFEVGFFDTPLGWTYGVAVSGSYAYVAEGNRPSLRVIDVSDPSSPAEVGYHETSHESLSVTMAANAGMEIFRECGVWVFWDDFETGDTSAWSMVVP